MKTVTLLRHAKSSWKEAGMADHERPLNGRGRRDAPEMGRRLARRGSTPEHIVSSTAVRARTTAEAVAAEMGCPGKALVTDERLYEASPDTLLAVLREQSDVHDRVMLVGHNPGLTAFANAMTGDRLDNIPTGAAYTLAIPILHWRQAGYGSAIRVAFEAPKDDDRD